MKMNRTFAFLLTLMTMLSLALSCTKEKTNKISSFSFVNPIDEGEEYFMYVDDKLEVALKVNPVDANEPVFWTFSDESVAKLAFAEDERGYKVFIQAIGEGRTEVIATTKSGLKHDFYLRTENGPQPLKSFVLSETKMTLKVGQGAELSIISDPANAYYTGEDWSISDEKILEYSFEEDGTYSFEAIAVGRANVTCTIGDITRSCEVTVVSSLVSLENLLTEENNNSMTKTVKEYERFSISPKYIPSNASNKSIKWNISNPSIVKYDGSEGGTHSFYVCGTGECVLKGTSVDGGKSIFYVLDIKPCDIPQGAVDMGYRKNGHPVYFAKNNLGASSPEQTGDFYAWGENRKHYFSLDPLKWGEGAYKNGYDLNSYMHYSPEQKKYTKYVSADDSVLKRGDDVAAEKLGGKWKIPASEDLLWLKNNCIITVGKTRDNQIYLEFSSKIEGFKVASVQLPLAGVLSGDKWQSFDMVGVYLSDSIETLENASTLVLSNSGNDGFAEIRPNKRYYGYTIRPVWDGFPE